MDDIKLFAKNEKELETLLHVVRIYSQDIGMEFGIEKCVMLVIKSGKWHLTDGMELPSQDKKARRKRNLQIFGHVGGIKQVEMKDKKERISQRNKKSTRDKTI